MRTVLLAGTLLLAACGAALDVEGPVPVTSDTASTAPSVAPGTPTDEERDVTTNDAGTRTIAYGDHPDQVLTVHLPSREPTGPTVVLIHGGFWREQYRADLMTPLAEDLAARGIVAVNIEYRRVGGDGGYPETFADVAAALDHLAEVDEVATDRLVTVGHSAGGHLAVWAAARHRIDAGEVGADPRVRPCGAVSQAGVIDLDLAVDLGLGDGATTALVGGTPADVPARYAVADPAQLLPLGIPVALVQGSDDGIVPPAIHRAYAAAARDAGDDVSEVELPGGHFEIIDVTHPLWDATAEAATGLC